MSDQNVRARTRDESDLQQALAAQLVRWASANTSECTASGVGSAVVLVTHDGLYRLWREGTGWRRAWRWCQRNVTDHARGWFHGCGADLAEALRAIGEHRENYEDD